MQWRWGGIPWDDVNISLVGWRHTAVEGVMSERSSANVRGINFFSVEKENWTLWSGTDGGKVWYGTNDRCV